MSSSIIRALFAALMLFGCGNGEKTLSAEKKMSATAIEKQLAAARETASKLGDQLVKAGDSPTISAKLKDTEARIVSLEADLAKAKLAGVGPVSAANPESIVNALIASGYSAELRKDSVGDPLIDGETSEGGFFSLYFYACVNHQDCETVQFQRTYDYPNGVSQNVVDGWNARGNLNFIHVWLNAQGDPDLRGEFALPAEGTPASTFNLMFSKWLGASNDFVAFVEKPVLTTGPVVRAADPQSLVDALVGAGYQASLGQTAAGAPQISIASTEIPLTLYFYLCDAPCNPVVQASTWWDMPNGLPAEKANAFHDQVQGFSIFLDKNGDPHLNDYYVMPAAGISRPEFVAVVAAWAEWAKRFSAFALG